MAIHMVPPFLHVKLKSFTKNQQISVQYQRAVASQHYAVACRRQLSQRGAQLNFQCNGRCKNAT